MCDLRVALPHIAEHVKIASIHIPAWCESVNDGSGRCHLVALLGLISIAVFRVPPQIQLGRTHDLCVTVGLNRRSETRRNCQDRNCFVWRSSSCMANAQQTLASQRFDLPESLKAELQDVYELSENDLASTARQLLPAASLETLLVYIATLSAHDQAVALRATLLLQVVSQKSKIPRTMQLECVRAIMARQDSLVTAGTGSGKTIAMLLAVLLDPLSITLVVSPLIRLQINQVSLFPLYFCGYHTETSGSQVADFAQYGVRAQCVNSDTSDDEDLWKVCSFWQILIW